jgi:hypothetical protein
MRFGTWIFWSLHTTDALKTVARELGTCKLNSVGVQEVRWEKGGRGLRKETTWKPEE